MIIFFVAERNAVKASGFGTPRFASHQTKTVKCTAEYEEPLIVACHSNFSKQFS